MGATETLAFFGATGGCTLEAITRALKAGYECNALARTPSKLTDLLAKNGVSEDIINTKLHIVKGDVRNAGTVKENLILNGRLVDIILSGVGGTTFAEISTKGLDICQITIKNVLASLKELKAEVKVTKKPLLVSISSTGMTEGQEARDLPYAWYPIYHVMLAIPHTDKKEMEKILTEHMAQPEMDRVISGYVLPRPAWLTNGPALGSGPKGLRYGLEDKPAVGYTVSRADVGQFLFEYLIEGKDRETFINHRPSLAY